jgi:DNA-binding transcriptional MerR regulator
MEKSPEAYRTIREVADSMDLPQHVLRFWETRFPQIRPLKRAGGRRYYRPDDIERLRLIRRLLYDEGYTIKGVQKLFKGQGAQALLGGAQVPDPPPAELADGGAPPTASNGAGVSRPTSELTDDDLAALREALAAIVDAEGILARARSPDS